MSKPKALIDLQAEIGVSYKTVLRMRDLVKRAARKYRGRQTEFGAWPRSFMTRGSMGRWNYKYVKQKQLAEGKHQSEHTITSTGVLSGRVPTECLLRLLLATPKPTTRRK
jgi:hypothetical protein